ncbi:uncharacterized protein [Ptychodera flava]|uniref:uncharacterized protein n=1 Tax=Ptychodera flava TaxID=63121 RepID=UPI00396A318F
MRLYLAEKCEEAFDAHVFWKTFVIDNSKSGTPGEDPDIQELRECLTSIAEAKLFAKDVPLKWLWLELALDLKRELTKAAETSKSLMDSATELGISKESKKDILKHFHEIGMVYLYKHLIVFDTEWLTSFLGRVISIRLGDVQTQYGNKERSVIDLRRHGILHKELLDDILRKDYHRKDIPIEEIDNYAECKISKVRNGDHVTNATQNSPTQNHLLCCMCRGFRAENDECNGETMELSKIQARADSEYEGEDAHTEHCGLLAPTNRERDREDTHMEHNEPSTQAKSAGEKVMTVLQEFDLVYRLDSADQSMLYIVPSLLPLGKREVIPLGEEKCNHTIPLYYHFSGGFLPEGFYYRLVVRCLNFWGKHIDVKDPKQMDIKDLKQNLKYHHTRIPVSKRHILSLTKKGPDIIMVMWYSTSDRWFQPLSTKPEPSICISSRAFVERTMNDIIKNWMPTLRYEAMVRCCCKGHQSTNKNTDSENRIDDDNFVYHDVKVNPPYQASEVNQSAPSENVEQNEVEVDPPSQVREETQSAPGENVEQNEVEVGPPYQVREETQSAPGENVEQNEVEVGPPQIHILK